MMLTPVHRQAAMMIIEGTARSAASSQTRDGDAGLAEGRVEQPVAGQHDPEDHADDDQRRERRQEQGHPEEGLLDDATAVEQGGQDQRDRDQDRAASRACRRRCC